MAACAAWRRGSTLTKVACGAASRAAVANWRTGWSPLITARTNASPICPARARSSPRVPSKSTRRRPAASGTMSTRTGRPGSASTTTTLLSSPASPKSSCSGLPAYRAGPAQPGCQPGLHLAQMLGVVPGGGARAGEAVQEPVLVDERQRGQPDPLLAPTGRVVQDPAVAGMPGLGHEPEAGRRAGGGVL